MVVDFFLCISWVFIELVFMRMIEIIVVNICCVFLVVYGEGMFVVFILYIRG